MSAKIDSARHALKQRGYVHAPGSTSTNWLRVSLIATAVIYAFFAGLRTVADFDTGWQLATGRYIVQHHVIPSTDVFSYTAQGQPWLYPPFSGLFLYLLFLVGGYSALSWLSAIASVATVGLITWRGSGPIAALAIVAVPAIVYRTVPRADLFTTLFFAAFAVVLWRHQEGLKVPLWTLPLLMVAWVNLHVGFLVGFALVGAYALTDAEMLFGEGRPAALSRLREILPWLLLCCVATLANPWGWRIYEAVARQDAASEILNGYIGEWSAIHWSSAVWSQAFSWRDPGSADWWMLAVAGIAAAVSLWKKQLAPAIILGLGAYVSLRHNRFQAIFAILVCIVGGSVLSRSIKAPDAQSFARSAMPGTRPRGGVSRQAIAAGLLAVLFASMVGLRIRDLVTDRFYLWSGQITLFGTGLSWWFPERAASFLRQQHLPGRLFNDYNLGGYLTWSVPEYPDYIDGRILPFGSELFARHNRLAGLPLDSPEWQKEADTRNIQTVIFSAARFGGLGNFLFQADCQSHNWAAVYLDDVSVVFVRKRPENVGLIRRLEIQCGTAALSAQVMASRVSSLRSSAERFQYLMNAASIEYLLSRDAEASANLGEAEKLFTDEPNLHLLKAELAQAHAQWEEAERQYKIALQLRPTDASWYALAGLYVDEHRYPQALHCVVESAALSTQDYDRYRALGKLYLVMNQPQDALSAFEKAARKSPFHGGTAALGVEFNARLAEGEAAAYHEMGDNDRAVTAQSQAVRLTPSNGDRWRVLADLYQARGQSEEAARARDRAVTLQAASPASPD